MFIPVLIFPRAVENPQQCSISTCTPVQASNDSSSHKIVQKPQNRFNWKCCFYSIIQNSLKSYRYACMHHNCANVNYKTIKIYFSHSLDMENVQHLYNVERETHRVNYKENTWNRLNMIYLYLVSLLTVLCVYAGAYMSCIHKHLFIPFWK